MQLRKLTVKRFSCLAEAEFSISPITLIVGPQASGKSILCKLSYFFVSLLIDQVRAIGEQTKHDEFTKQVKAKFLRWFAAETWGPQKFELRFDFGSSYIEIVRTVSKGKAGKGINVRFSTTLSEHYTQSLERLATKKTGLPSRLESPEYSFTSWNIERSVREDLRKVLGEEYVASQLFIPAARSFFTSIGKAIAAFENSNLLDPLTLLFGRMYAARDGLVPAENADDRAIQNLLKSATTTMLGGNLVRERDREVLRTTDGRTIPLGSLSSGQQEIFPLLRALPQGSFRSTRRIIYVEEPEAHLFPDAQSRLIELLSGLSNLYGPASEMVITTHSPYVLTKFNNLITAGRVGKRRIRSTSVNSIVPHVSWIDPGKLAAYAIEGGKLKNVVDSDGLIDGLYLDAVSNELGNEFTRLLDLEFADSRSSTRKASRSESDE